MSGKDTFETGGLYFAAYLKAARIPWKGCLPDNRDGRRGRMKFVFENSEEIPQLQWTAGYGMNSTSNRRIAARLYNSTDAVELDIKSVRPSVTTVTESAGGFAQVTFTGSAKTFLVQFRALDGTSTTGQRPPAKRTATCRRRSERRPPTTAPSTATWRATRSASSR